MDATNIIIGSAFGILFNLIMIGKSTIVFFNRLIMGVLISRYTGVGPEQGLKHCFRERLVQAAFPQTVQTSGIALFFVCSL